MPDLSGKMRSLEDYRGKWVIVNYWATWCPPCQEEIPDLVDFHDSHKDTDAVVLGVNFEDIGTVKVTPNPVSDIATIELNLIEPESINVYLTDLNGKLVKSLTNYYSTLSKIHKLTFYKGSLASGIYFININIGVNKKSIKVIIN